MSESLRVLCLNYEYPPVGGGGGRIAHRINAELVRRGHAVRVQTAGLRHLPAHEVVDGVEVFRTGSFRKKEDTCTVPEMGHYVVTSLLPVRRHIRQWKPHVIHAHFAVPTGALAFPASLLTSVPYVLTAHLGDVPGGVPEQTAGLFRLVQPFTIPIWKHAAAITAVSTFVADLAEAAYHRRPEVILNGIPLPAAPPNLAPHDPPRLLFVGRLSTQKNPLLALRALALIRDLPWELRIVGDGPLRGEMEHLVASEHLESRVTFLGWRDTGEVAAEMSRADALVLTSSSEGLPMAAIEALANGLALFGTRIPGLQDVVKDQENGTLAPPSPEGFAAAIRPALADSATLARFREAAWKRAPLFDLERTADGYERVLRRISAG